MIPPRNLSVYETPFEYPGQKELVAKLKVLLDVTDTEHIKSELKESEERHRAIIEAAQDAVVTADADGKILFWNPAAERIVGFNKADVLGKSLYETIVPPQYHDKKRAGMRIVGRSGEGAAVGQQLELTALRKNGVEFPISLSTRGKLFIVMFIIP